MSDRSAVTTAVEPGRRLSIPINHFDGNYRVAPETLQTLEDGGRVVLRYVANPNGSAHSIAGVCNKSGNVVRLVPHAEQPATSSWRRPTVWCSCGLCWPGPGRDWSRQYRGNAGSAGSAVSVVGPGRRSLKECIKVVPNPVPSGAVVAIFRRRTRVLVTFTRFLIYKWSRRRCPARKQGDLRPPLAQGTPGTTSTGTTTAGTMTAGTMTAGTTTAGTTSTGYEHRDQPGRAPNAPRRPNADVMNGSLLHEICLADEEAESIERILGRQPNHPSSRLLSLEALV